MIIYADVLFLVNLVLNGMILRITARAGGTRLSSPRLLCGAALGGAAAIALTALQLPALAALPLKLLTAPLMCLVAFGRRGIWRSSLLLLIVSFLFGGGIWALSLLLGGEGYRVGGISYAAVSLPMLFLSAAGLYALFGQLIFHFFSECAHCHDITAVCDYEIIRNGSEMGYFQNIDVVCAFFIENAGDLKGQCFGIQHNYFLLYVQ